MAAHRKVVYRGREGISMGILYDLIAKKAAKIAVEKYFSGMDPQQAIEEAAKECNIQLGKQKDVRNEDNHK